MYEHYSYVDEVALFERRVKNVFVTKISIKELRTKNHHISCPGIVNKLFNKTDFLENRPRSRRLSLAEFGMNAVDATINVLAAESSTWWFL